MIIGNAIVLFGGGSSAVLEPITITENGVYTPPTGVDGFSRVIVGVGRCPRCDQTMTFDFENSGLAWSNTAHDQTMTFDFENSGLAWSNTAQAVE